jgi:hypothetical protein
VCAEIVGFSDELHGGIVRLSGDLCGGIVGFSGDLCGGIVGISFTCEDKFIDLMSIILLIGISGVSLIIGIG